MSFRHRKQIRSFAAVCIMAAFTLSLTTASSLAKINPPFGTITKFATVPAMPGFPEGVAVNGNSVFVSGPARFGTSGTGPSTITVYNRKTGQLQQTIVVQGEALAFEHALSNSSQVGDEVPLDNPAGIAFDNRTKSVLIANHALLSGNPAHFAVLSAYVGETGDPLSQP